MSKKIVKGALLAVTALLLVMAFSGCVLLVEVSGRVVDARSTSSTNPGIDDVKVTVSASGSTFATYTNSEGYWSAMVEPDSSYDITYSKTGYYIPSTDVLPTDPYNENIIIPAVPLELSKVDTYDFVLVWETSEDLNLYFTYPNATYNPGSLFNTPNEDGYDTSNGFGPLTLVESQRTQFGVPNTPTGTRAENYVNRTSVMENINFNFSDIGASQFLPGGLQAITGTTQNGLGSGSFYWNGICQIYVDTASTTGNISNANARLFVFKTTTDDGLSADVTLKGVFPAPTNLDTLEGLSLLRINFFRLVSDTNLYGIQLTPETMAIPGGSDYFFNIQGSSELLLRG